MQTSDLDAPPPSLYCDVATFAGHSRRLRWQRLSGGMTNKSWRVTGPGIDWVVKHYDQALDNPLFPNSAPDEAAILGVLGRTGLTPTLVAKLVGEFGTSVIYTHAPGNSWQDDFESAITALKQVHSAKAPQILRKTPNGSEEISSLVRKLSMRCAPEHQEELKRLRPSAQSVPKMAGTVLLHGDPVPTNFVFGASRTIMIDWQCPAIGDPVHDLAVLLSPAMHVAYGFPSPTEEQQNTTVAKYNDGRIAERFHLLRPWYHWLMMAYCAFKLQSGRAEYRRGYALELAELQKYFG